MLCLSLVIITLDNTILNVALPTLQDQLHATNSQLQWMVDSYTLVFAGLLLSAGSLGDRFGRKGALQLGLAIFALGSLASSLATTPDMLIFTRALMGIGGAFIMPGTLSILTNVFPDEERARAIGVWAGVSALGIAIGPLLGGFLIEHFSWHAIFTVNIPIAAIAIVAGIFIVPKSKDPSAPRLDPIGALLSIIGLFSLVYALIEAPTEGWGDTKILAGFGIAVVALAAFAWWELHTDEPMLDVNFFKNPRFTAASSSIALVFFAMFGFSFLLTQYFQFVLGYSAQADRRASAAPRPDADDRGAPVGPGRRAARHEGGRRHRSRVGVGRAGTLRRARGAQPVLAGLLAHGHARRRDGLRRWHRRPSRSWVRSRWRRRASARPSTTPRVRSVVRSASRSSVRSCRRSTVRRSWTRSQVTTCPPRRVAGAKGSLGGALELAQQTHQPALAQLAKASFVDGMHTASFVAAGAAAIGVVVSLLFLPARARARDVQLQHAEYEAELEEATHHAEELEPGYS